MAKAMLSTLFCGILVLFGCSGSKSEEGITGLWKSRDQNVDIPRSLVAIYEYDGQFYGRTLATYNDNGEIKDTILEKKEKSTGVVGNPPYCGMDFIYHVTKEDDEDKYQGKILDPQKGHVYNVELWREGKDLIVRGELGIALLGKNIPWHPASEKDLPKGFSMSDIKSFVPVVPEAL